MARIARIIAPDLPHHVTQRGNRRQKLFVEESDYALYRDLLAERCHANGVACWAYCLMPNHVHLILTPSSEIGLSRAVGEAHRRYTAFFNARARVTGHLFQGRFACSVMDEDHLMNALRYLAFDPVRARRVKRPEDWPHSSVAAHLAGKNDELVDVTPGLARAPQFRQLLGDNLRPAEAAAFELAGANGRPMGGEAFLTEIEARLGRMARPQKRGPKPGAIDTGAIDK
jgi:putative transposase